jgi:hypothetical protein
MTNRWDVRNGMFYQDGEPYKIVKLTQSVFHYEAVRESGVQVEGKYVVTCRLVQFFHFAAPPERWPNNNGRIY